MEATVVTGPAKNLLAFARAARVPTPGRPAVDLHLVVYERGEPNPFAEAARAAGVEVDVIRERRRFDPAVFEQLSRIVERRRPDLVQTHNVKSHFLLRCSGLWRRYRWIGFHHGYTTTDPKMRLYNQLDRWSLRAAHHLVTVCGPFVEQLKGRGVRHGRIAVVHNAVTPLASCDAAALARLRDQHALPSGVPVVATMGRLSREKGHLVLVEAARHLRTLHAGPFQVWVLGEGPERGRLERAIAEAGLGSHVRLLGFHQNTAPYLSLADIVVLPSFSEGSPNALLEAMAAGKPVVATAVGGIPEIVVGGETGLLVPPGRPEALAAELARLLRDPGLAARLGSAGQIQVTGRHAPATQHQQILDVYQTVLQRPALVQEV
jgi:glycosyltransferase involved in cell wall biosynthesis